jgi:hypothetical protein
MKNLLCVLGLCLTLGCTTAIVRPYVGEQQAWPTSVGSIVNTRYDLPVFTSLPPAAYDVIAELRVNSPLYAQPEEKHLPVLCKKGLEIGADALVLVEGKVYFSTSYGVSDSGAAAPGSKVTVTQVNRFNPDSFRKDVSVIAVRWTGEPPIGLPAKYAKFKEGTVEGTTPSETPTPAPPPPAVPDQPPTALPTVPDELIKSATTPESPAPPPPPAPPEQPAPAAPPTPEPPPEAPAAAAPPEPPTPPPSAGEMLEKILEGPKAEPSAPPPGNP